jgi:hypothetical protein
VLIGTTASIRNAPVTFTVALPLVKDRALIFGGFAGVLPWAASGGASHTPTSIVASAAVLIA